MPYRFLYRLAVYLGASLALLCGCSTMKEAFPPTVSSTQGSTLVEEATVISIRQLPALSKTTAHFEVQVQFDDGRSRPYFVDSVEKIHPGNRVRILHHYGTVRMMPIIN